MATVNFPVEADQAESSKTAAARPRARKPAPTPPIIPQRPASASPAFESPEQLPPGLTPSEWMKRTGIVVEKLPAPSPKDSRKKKCAGGKPAPPMHHIVDLRIATGDRIDVRVAPGNDTSRSWGWKFLDFLWGQIRQHYVTLIASAATFVWGNSVDRKLYPEWSSKNNAATSLDSSPETVFLVAIVATILIQMML